MIDKAKNRGTDKTIDGALAVIKAMHYEEPLIEPSTGRLWGNEYHVVIDPDSIPPAKQAILAVLDNAKPMERPLVPYGSLEFDSIKDAQNSGYNNALRDFTKAIHKVFEDTDSSAPYKGEEGNE